MATTVINYLFIWYLFKVIHFDGNLPSNQKEVMSVWTVHQDSEKMSSNHVIFWCCKLHAQTKFNVIDDFRYLYFSENDIISTFEIEIYAYAYVIEYT